MSAQVIRTLVALAGLACAVPVAAASENQCGVHAAEIVRKAYPTARPQLDNAFEVEGAALTIPAADGGTDDNPKTMMCRIWPARPELMLVAVPLMTRQADDFNEGDLELLVVDASSFDVKQRFRREGLMGDDAFRITSLSFDTARYRLAPGKLAFGLRLTRYGSSRPNPFGETALWLFSIDDGHLRPVLDNILVLENGGEWDTNCAGEFEAIERTLAMSPSKGDAMADILITETVTTSVNTVDSKGECQRVDKTKTQKRRLRYKGSAYVVPQGLGRTD